MGFEVQPLALPATCSKCGYGGNARRYFDFNISVDFYGVVYLCDECFAEAIAGFQSDTVVKLRATVTDLRNTLKEVTSERDTYRSAISRAVASINAVDSGASVLTEAVNEAESDTDESTREWRPVGILDTPTDDE